MIARVFVVVAVVAWAGMLACVIAIWVAAGDVRNRSLHMRLNRLNILADRSLWTPTIAALNRAAVRFGLVWFACTIVGVLASF
jgi:hypothetical protein